MSSFERFRRVNRLRMDTQEKTNNNFIFSTTSSTPLTEYNTDTTIAAVVVSEQEKDKAYIYTRSFNPLTIGSVWGTKGLYWLISEEIIIIKDVHYHKYLALLCNFNVEDTWGYFKGPEASYINITTHEKTVTESLQKPILVLPANILNYEDKIVIKNRPWLVQEYDAISTPGIIYYSLRATTVSKAEIANHENEDTYIVPAVNNYTDVIITPEESEDTENSFTIGHNIDITENTVDGYFKFDNPNIKIKKHTNTEIVFNLPFGVNEVTVQIKEGEDIVSHYYIAE